MINELSGFYTEIYLKDQFHSLLNSYFDENISSTDYFPVNFNYDNIQNFINKDLKNYVNNLEREVKL